MKQYIELIEQLKSFIDKESLLIEVEDRYVYSFEKVFMPQAYPLPNIVIKVPSPLKASQIIDWADKENIHLIDRKKAKPLTNIDLSKGFILLDTIKHPEITYIIKENERYHESYDKLHILPKNMQSILNNIATAIKQKHLQQEFNLCQQSEIGYGYCSISHFFDEIETWTAKGRMLLIKGVLKGDLAVSKKFIDVLYTCSTCGHCFAECFTDLKFRKVITNMRHWVAERNQVPDAFLSASKNIIEYGDPGATPIDKRTSWMREITPNELQDHADILLWVGCMVATRTPKTVKALTNILKHTQIEFTSLGAHEGCCGYVLLSSGLWNEAEKVANTLFEKVRKTKAKTLITPCAGCYYTFTKLYPEILKINLPLEVLHSSHFIENIVKELNLNSINASIAYHDPCSLGRHCKVFNAPRNVLREIPGLKLIEPPLNREHSRCCGGGGGLWTYNHLVSMKTAFTRLVNDIIPHKIDILTTACPQCQMNFRITSRRNKLPVQIQDITEVVEKALT